MFKERVEIIRKGDPSGNGMIFKLITPGGIEIFGLGTKNNYGGEWDLGATWNYLVLTEEPFLVDTGRTGTCDALLEMIETTGFPIQSLKTIVLSHGHEDHDGGLPQLVEKTGARVLAHPIYEKLIRLMPENVPEGINKNFPPSCWHCPMPVSFVDENCAEYHKNRHALTIENISESDHSLGEGIKVLHLPGHSPDGIGIIINPDIVLVGDNVLPHISPMPSKNESFHLLADVLPVDDREVQKAFGLTAYLRSLKKLIELGGEQPDILALPGHRFYYYDQWNDFDLKTRAQEIVIHHIERCGDILDIVSQEPKTVKAIMTAHFDPSLLKGTGAGMAKNEIQSHLELLIDSSDITPVDDQQFLSTGKGCFESYIQALEPW